MTDDREKISTGPNERALNETIAGTGPGIPDEALAPGQELPEPPSDEEVERIAKKLDSPRQNETHFRWKVNESRQNLTQDSVTVQFS